MMLTVAAVVHDASHTALRDVFQDLASGGDLLGFPRIGDRQRHPDGVADAPADELLEGDAGLDDAVRRQSRLGDAEVERNVRPLRANRLLTSMTLAGSESLSETQ